MGVGRGRQCLNYSKWNSHLLPRWWEDGLGQGRGERDAGYQGIEKYTTLRKLVWHSPFFVKKPITSLNDWQSSGFRAMVVLIHSGSFCLNGKDQILTSQPKAYLWIAIRCMPRHLIITSVYKSGKLLYKNRDGTTEQ